jgi:hypothetical protein
MLSLASRRDEIGFGLGQDHRIPAAIGMLHEEINLRGGNLPTMSMKNCSIRVPH